MKTSDTSNEKDMYSIKSNLIQGQVFLFGFVWRNSTLDMIILKMEKLY